MSPQPYFQYAPDIDEQILAALSFIFTNELQTLVDSTDPLWVRTVKVIPLQDDPTLTAPYVTFGPDYERGIVSIIEGEWARQYGSAEIGGPAHFLYHYSVICGTLVVTTREQCSAQIGNLSSRVVDVLMRHFDLSRILSTGMLQSQDGSRFIEGANSKLVDSINRRLKGGEQTWFGEATILFHYPVSLES
jgi:hypothetical protein